MINILFVLNVQLEHFQMKKQMVSVFIVMIIIIMIKKVKQHVNLVQEEQNPKEEN